MTFNKDHARIFEASSIPGLLLDRCERVSFSKGATVIAEDAPLLGVYCVVSGRICSYVVSPEGSRAILAIIEEGGSFGESDILLEASSISAAFVAETDCELLFVARDDLVGYMAVPEIALYFARCLSKKFLSTARMYVESVGESAMGRVGGAFLDLDRQYGIEEDGVRVIGVRVTQQYLADYLSLSRLTVNKCVGRLQELKLVRKIDDRYWIPSKEKLSNYMELIK